MTGRTGPAWNWLSSCTVPIVWAAAEMTWISLWMAVFANASPGFRIGLPYALFAVPGVSAAALAGVSRRWRWSRARRLLSLAPLLLLGAAVTAGVTSEIAVRGSFLRAAVAPWTAAGRPPLSTAVALGWLVALVVWVRGAWLGAVDASFAHAVRSVGVALTAFVLLFIAIASTSEPAVHDVGGSAGLLFVTFCPAAAAVVALVHERDLERRVLLRAASRPSLAWIGVLAIPMLAVTLGALVVVWIGDLLTPAAAWVLSPVTAPAGALAGVIRSAVAGLFSQEPRGWPALHAQTTAPVHAPPPRPTAGAVDISTPPFILWGVLAVVGLVMVVAAAPLLIPRWGRWSVPAADVDEERDSVFSWRRLAERMRDRMAWHHGGAEDGSTPAAWLSPVRLAYRDLLTAARARNLGRRAAETPDEFEQRIAPLLGAGSAAPLSVLTDGYRRARYDHHPVPDSGEQAAVAAAASLVTALSDPRGG
jgi:Domain of unknown function (DUF4129)